MTFARCGTVPSVTSNSGFGEFDRMPTTRPRVELRAGDEIGRYRLLGVLGEGGMGTVWEAVHIDIRRRAAIKVLRQRLTKDAQSVSRFFKEALAVNRIKHPSIIEIYDAVDNEDMTYLVLELLEGQTLRNGLEHVTFAEPSARQIGAQIASALSAVHRAGIIHRDLKPENIFLQDDENGDLKVRILDFGVAKLSGLESTEKMTETADGVIVGTPAYMAPEQASGADIDHRVDVYAFGCIMYEIIAGQPPFRCRNLGEYLLAHMTETPEDPRERSPHVSDEMSSLIMACLEKQPEDRPQDLHVVAAILRGWESHPIPVAPGPEAPPTVRPSTRLDLPPPDDEEKTFNIPTPSALEPVAPPAAIVPASNKQTLIWAALAIAVVLVSGIVFFAVQRDDDDDAEVTAPAPAEPASWNERVVESTLPADVKVTADPDPTLADDAPTPTKVIPAKTKAAKRPSTKKAKPPAEKKTPAPPVAEPEAKTDTPAPVEEKVEKAEKKLKDSSGILDPFGQ